MYDTPDKATIDIVNGLSLKLVSIVTVFHDISIENYTEEDVSKARMLAMAIKNFLPFHRYQLFLDIKREMLYVRRELDRNHSVTTPQNYLERGGGTAAANVLQKIPIQAPCYGFRNVFNEMLYMYGCNMRVGFSKTPLSVLLYGLSGVGKTQFLKGFAAYIGIGFQHVQCSTVFEKWVGASEQNLARIFTKGNKPRLVLFDEIEGLTIAGGAHDYVGRRVLLDMQQHMDTLCERTDLFLCATTNFPKQVPAPLMRRFFKKIYIGPPDADARFKIIKNEYPEIGDTNISVLADRMRGWVGADIVHCMRGYRMKVIEKTVDMGGMWEDYLGGRHLTDPLSFDHDTHTTTVDVMSELHKYIDDFHPIDNSEIEKQCMAFLSKTK